MFNSRLATPLVWLALGAAVLALPVATAASPAKRPNQAPDVRITSAGPVPLIAPATITIAADASDEDGTVKSVKFFAGAKAIGTATKAPFSVTWRDVEAGAYRITAIATDNNGAATTSAAVTVTVVANTPPLVRITSPSSGGSLTAPATITLNAEATDADGSIRAVRFFVDGRPVGARSHGPYTATFRRVAAGTYHVTAMAIDNLGARTTSAPVSIVVTPNVPPTVAITSPTAGRSFALTDIVAVTASTDDVGGGRIRAVRFFADARLIGVARQAPYAVTWTGATAGTHTLTAIAVDNAGLRTTSAPIGITVQADDPQPPPVPATEWPLVQAGNLVYEGAFRLPDNVVDSSGNGFGYGGSALAYNPARDSLFVVGFANDQNVAEIAIPSIINSPVLGELDVARTILQPFTDVTEGLLSTINPGDPNLKAIGGILPYLNRLYLTGFAVYDGLKSQVLSHFVSGLDFSIQGDIAGPLQVGTVGAGFVSGYFGLIPADWQDALGGPVLNGNCCLNIITRTSYGPAAFAIDPAQLGFVDPLPATPLVYYPLDHHSLGDWDVQSEVFNGATEVKGVVFPEHTRSVLFFGRQGLGPFCYGIGGAEGGQCYDPSDPYKGTHAYPYSYYVWAYDANDLAAVKRGEKQPWEVAPYAYWPLTLPFADTRAHILGATYDAANNRIFISQAFGDADRPIVHVYSVHLP